MTDDAEMRAQHLLAAETLAKTEAYVRAGRIYEALPTGELLEQFGVAFRAFADDVSRGPQWHNDIEAELSLRGIEAPLAEYLPEIDRIKKVVMGAFRELSTERFEEINDSLEAEYDALPKQRN